MRLSNKNPYNRLVEYSNIQYAIEFIRELKAKVWKFSVCTAQGSMPSHPKIPTSIVI